MKIAVLGANGMLGSRVVEELSRKSPHMQVAAFTRDVLDLRNKNDVIDALSDQFDWIVNCSGIVKSREKDDLVETVLVNAMLPHVLEDCGGRIIHVSTDCVFSGKKGNYSEIDDPDPVDLYGATKAAGELVGPESTTIRTSFIGWEKTQRGLLSWLVRQKGVIPGYLNALWSGLSAREVARVITKIITEGYPLGLVHLNGEKISKFFLLTLLAQKFDLDVEVIPKDEPRIDRTLVVSGSLDYKTPDWDKMADELVRERP